MTSRRMVIKYIYPENPLYDYCAFMSESANNLYREIHFRQEKLISSRTKSRDSLTDEERLVLDEIDSFIPGTRTFTYSKLSRLLKSSKNSAYYRKGFPRNSAQRVVRHAMQATKNRPLPAFYYIPCFIEGSDCKVEGETVRFPHTKNTLDVRVDGDLKEVKIELSEGAYKISLISEVVIEPWSLVVAE